MKLLIQSHRGRSFVIVFASHVMTDDAELLFPRSMRATTVTFWMKMALLWQEMIGM